MTQGIRREKIRKTSRKATQKTSHPDKIIEFYLFLINI